MDIMTRKKKTTIRIFPESWVEACDFRMFFPVKERPLELKYWFGKGSVLLARSGRFPEVNFLGIERQLIRVNRSGGSVSGRVVKMCDCCAWRGIMRSVG